MLYPAPCQAPSLPLTGFVFCSRCCWQLLTGLMASCGLTAIVRCLSFISGSVDGQSVIGSVAELGGAAGAFNAQLEAPTPTQRELSTLPLLDVLMDRRNWWLAKCLLRRRSLLAWPSWQGCCPRRLLIWRLARSPYLAAVGLRLAQGV